MGCRPISSGSTVVRAEAIATIFDEVTVQRVESCRISICSSVLRQHPRGDDILTSRLSHTINLKPTRITRNLQVRNLFNNRPINQ
jgi:hypothetical protein